MWKKCIFLCVAWLTQVYSYALTGIEGSSGSISGSDYKLNVFKLFPTTNLKRWQDISNNGVDNIGGWVSGMVTLLSTLMAIGATVMLILGGFHMVMGGADSEQTEKGKTVIKDAIMGLIIGLLAYVIIITLGNFFNF